MDFRFLKPIVFDPLFLLGPFPPHLSDPSIFTHIRFFVAHCYLPLAVVSAPVPVSYNQALY